MDLLDKYESYLVVLAYKQIRCTENIYVSGNMKKEKKKEKKKSPFLLFKGVFDYSVQLH